MQVFRGTIAILAATLLALPALAEQAATGGQTPEEQRETANKEQAESAVTQNAENLAREQNYQDALKAHEAEVARLRAAQADYEAKKAAYDQAMAAWRARMCAAGYATYCPPK